MAKVVKPSSRLMNFSGKMRPRNLLIGCYLNPVFVSREVRKENDYAKRAENRFRATETLCVSLRPMRLHFLRTWNRAGDEPLRARGSAEGLWAVAKMLRGITRAGYGHRVSSSSDD